MSNVNWDEIHKKIDEAQLLLDGNHISENDLRHVLHERAKLLSNKFPFQSTVNRLEVIEFFLNTETYGVESKYVSRICEIKNLTSLPCTPEFIEGIINVHGNIICVVDLKLFLNLEKKPIGKSSRIIIVEHDNVSIGLIVDEITKISLIIEDELQPSLPNISVSRRDFLKAVSKNQCVILDMEKIISSNELEINETV